MSKVAANAAAAVADIFTGATVMIGGFGLCGVPDNLVDALVTQGSRDLHIISGTMGTDHAAQGLLIASGQMKSFASSYVGENKVFEQMYLNVEIELELTPQGTQAERC